jgi:putative salt-induced outer membrane protein YdiY
VKADQLTLKNGDRVTGKVVRYDGKTVVVKSDLLGDISVAIDNVSAITADKPLYVTLADGRTVVGAMNTTGDSVKIKTTSGEVAVSRAAIVGARSEEEQHAYEKTLDPGWLEQWTGGADFGVALTRGNSDTTNLALGVGMTRQTLQDKTSIYAASIYNRDKTGGISRTTANTTRFGVRYDRDINRNWFFYAFTDLERNGQQDLNLRVVPGGGLGYHAIRNERTQLDLLGGLAMNREYFDGDDNDRTSLEAQVGQTLVHRLNSRVSLKEQLFVFPNLSDTGEYRINFDTTLVTDITRRIGWQITVSDRYLSNPPAGLKQNDLVLTTGIHLKLGEIK